MMQSLSINNTQVQEIHEIIVKPAYVLYAEYEQVVRECDFLRHKLEAYEEEHSFKKHLDRVSSNTLGVSHKATISGVWEYLRDEAPPPNEDGYYHIQPWRIGAIRGQGDGTVNSNLNYCSTVHEDGKPTKTAVLPLFDKRLVKIPDASKPQGFHEETYIKPLDLFPQPAYYEAACTQLRNHGGAGRGQGRKPKCENCGGDLQEKERIISIQPYTLCPRCKITHVSEVEQVNFPLPVSSNQVDFDDPESDPENRVSSNQVDFDDPTCNQVDAVDLTNVPYQVDCDPLKTSNQVDFEVIEQDELSTPPVLRSDLEVELEAAQLLLDIAGDHANHIQMNMQINGEYAKYGTVHRPLTTKDMINHLRGITTKGFYQRSSEGDTRAICYDPDDPQEWERMQQAARLLAVIGFSPLLIPSPVQNTSHTGGGQCWIILADNADTYSVIQTIRQYTGDLLKGMDMWPGGGINMRMPGGKYVKPGFSAWCEMYDAYGKQLTHDGVGAAQVLLEYQAPIDLIIHYDCPQPEPIPQPVPRATKQGGYLEKDVVFDVIADFNARTSWDSLAARCGGYDRRNYFPAMWRGNRPPYDVHVDPETDLAKDFGTSAWLPYAMNQYQVYCLLEGGTSWEAFKKRDLAKRCKEYREQSSVPSCDRTIEETPRTELFVVETPKQDVQLPYDATGLLTRMTLCCDAPFMRDALGKPVCSNPACPKRERIAS